MASLPVEILLGIYLGLLVGVIPALVSWALGFAFKYFTGVSIPGLGVVVLAIALAGVSGGLLALADESITQAPNAERVITAILLVGMVSLYAHSKGDKMGAEFPKRLSLRGLRDRRLSGDVVELVGGRDEVRIRVVGDVADMEGYPPLSDSLRAEIRDDEWTFPVDLTIGELEARLEERLRTEFDLGDVAVTIDEKGRATVVAAPPAACTPMRPAGTRASRPMPIPTRWIAPVATTNPIAKSRAEALPGSSSPWAKPWNTAKTDTTATAAASGGRAFSSMQAPITTIDSAIAHSTPGRGTPAMPRTAPSAITSGKATGRAQMAGAPRNAPQSPTASIASRWSKPKTG